MTHRIYREALAELDIIEHIDYLDQVRPGSALDFIDALEKAFALLSEQPEIGAKRIFDNPRLGEIRLWPVTDFRPYLIFYRIEADTVRVLRVLHGSRDIATLFEEDR